ncbi:hypothetical protein QEN19_002171 [Hanseniaspora menglaensis]
MRLLNLQTFLNEGNSVSLTPPSSATNSNTNLAIYCVDLSKNGNLFAVGTIDGCIKVYDMTEKKLLSTLDSHNGTVTCLKWSLCGNFLISGSDDKSIIVWHKQQLNNNNQKMIHFQLLKRLIGHESDVQNLSLNNMNNILMSCGLDCKIIIWQFNTTTLQFNKLEEFNNIHSNFIKGCEFDPTGKFFATISDDKVLKIYKYSFRNISNEFKLNLEVEIAEPFADSKSFKVTYFSKMHWSPNGQFLIIPNGKSGSLENCCILIDRLNNWDYSFKLIGNAMPIEVCKFNPVIFVKEEEYKKNDSALNSVSEQNLLIATGGQEKCLVLWSTTKSVPLLVLKNLFKKQISDLAWDKQGCNLFISSFDGDVKILEFENITEITEFVNLTSDIEEKLKAVDPAKNFRFLQKFGNIKESKTNGDDNTIVETIEDIELSKNIKSYLPLKYLSNKSIENKIGSEETDEKEGFAYSKNAGETQPVVNILVAKRRSNDKNDRNADGSLKKRRVMLKPATSTVATENIATRNLNVKHDKKNGSENNNEELTFNVKNLSKSFVKIPRLGYQTLIQGLKETEELELHRMFANTADISNLSSKIGLSATAISTVVPDTDLHTVVSNITDHVFEIRNSKERMLLYNNWEKMNENYSNLTKITCFKNGVSKWEFFCKENITQAFVLSKNHICLILDDHQLVILSIHSGLSLINKLYFSDRILHIKSIHDNQDQIKNNEPYLLLISENGALTLMKVEQMLLKEISTSHLFYSNMTLGSDSNRSEKIHCFKKLYKISLNRSNQIVLDLVVFDELYNQQFEKYMSTGSHSNNKARFFKFDSTDIFKQLRKQKFAFESSQNALLRKESYCYCPEMSVWLLLD